MADAATELDGLRREINSSRRRLILLKLEQAAITENIRRLRRTQRNLVRSVRASNMIYNELQSEIQAMVNFLPLTADEKEKIQSVIANKS